jgi:ribonucleoside-diphosphate reductase alpha chain
MRMHRDAVADIHPSCPLYLLNAAHESAERMLTNGERYGYRNAQATVLAPTGTIAFMMDCDTTGIEPDIALVKYKLLAGKGDGMLKIVNRTVPEALRVLGYSGEEVEAIMRFVEENDTIEGAPKLKNQHLPVFDCAFKPFKGTRSIHHFGHLKMMAACQPFISGAISKTVNMPEQSTVEEIAEAYAMGWELGLKAMAIYRENSKRSQPLSTSKGGNTQKSTKVVEAELAESSGDGMAVGEPQVIERIVERVVHTAERRRLPDERPSITHKFSIAGHEGYLHIGQYPDTRMPGEIFITMAKQGSTISGLMDAFATSISIALQYGVPLEDLCNKFSHMRFEPAGFTNNRQIPIAKSIMDYIFRYLSLKFLAPNVQKPSVKNGLDDEIQQAGPAADVEQVNMFSATTTPKLVGSTVEAFLGEPAETAVATQSGFKNQEDAPPCSNCGSITVRAGSCYSCPNCGNTSGCG